MGQLSKNKLFFYFLVFSPILLIFIFLFYFLPKNSLERFNGRASQDIMRILKKNKNENVGIFLLGNSRVNRGVDPKSLKINSNNKKVLNVALRGRTYIRTYGLIQEIFNLGYKPDYFIVGVNLESFYYDSLPLVVKDIRNKNNSEFELFIKNNLYNIYGKSQPKFNSKNISEYKKVIDDYYFSLIDKVNFQEAKDYIYILRHTYNHKLFLKEPFYLSKAFDISLYESYLLSSQRFLFVLNRSIQENFISLKKEIYWRIFPSRRKLNIYDDVFWMSHFGDRDGPEQPEVSNYISNSSVLDRYKGFNYGIPTLDYSNWKLSLNSKAKLDLLLLNEIRKLIKNNNSKVIFLRIPRLYDRYPNETEIDQIRNYLPEFIMHPKEIHQNLMKMENYGDPRHFNLKGRKIYEKWLSNYINDSIYDLPKSK